MKRLREARGLSQTALQQLSSVPQSRISAIENGRVEMPDGPTLLALAVALAVSLNDLLLGVNAEYDAAHATPDPIAEAHVIVAALVDTVLEQTTEFERLVGAHADQLRANVGAAAEAAAPAIRLRRRGRPKARP